MEEKKKNQNDKPIIVGLSFEDGLRLAANTAPSKEIDISLNERTQIKGVSGRVIELVCIHSPIPKNNSLTGFTISAQIERDDIKDKQPPSEFVALTDPFSDTIELAMLNVNSEAKISVNKKERLYVTLKPPLNQETKIKSCILTYKKHTNF